MIVSPDFCDHWKTRMLVGLLGGDEAAPLYVIRIWGHCQNTKRGSLEGIPSDAMSAIARSPHPSEKLLSALVTCRFLDKTELGYVVHEWEEWNKSLLAAVRNGKKGGRPVKQKRKNPRDTDGIPMGNPSILSNLFSSLFSIPEFREEWEHFLQHRKAKGSKMTDHAQKLILKKLQERPAQAVHALQTAQQRGWSGIEWAWLDGPGKSNTRSNGTGLSPHAP